MKSRIAIFSIIFLITTAGAFCQITMADDNFTTIGDWKVVNGDWKITSDGKLVQLNTVDTMTRIYRKVDQYDTVTYEFDIGYLKGLEDNYGGVGIHILIDKPTNVRSWGNNDSYLLWITYDVPAYKEKTIYGQLYDSDTLISMKMVHNGTKYPIMKNLPIGKISTVVGKTVKAKIVVDTTTGILKIYDPLVANYYYEAKLGKALPRGSYFAFRTNSLSVVIDNFKVTIE